MTDFQEFASKSMLWAEGLAAFVGLLYYNRIRKEYWKFFVFFLVFIFLSEAYGRWGKFAYFF